MRSPQNFNSVGVHRSRFEYGALCLVFSHISLIQTRKSCTIFFMDSLFFKEYFSKFQFFFLTGSTNPQLFSSVGVHRNRFEYGHSTLFLVISPSSELGIVHRFFYGLLVLQEIFYQNFNFFLNRLDQSPMLQFSWSL